MKRISFITAIVAMALCMSCNGPVTPSDEEIFMGKTGVCMVVGTKEYISSDTVSLQTSLNPDKHIYRAGIPVSIKDKKSGLDVTIVEEYFVLMLEATPGDVESTIRGNLNLMSKQLRSGSQQYKDVEFAVKKIEGNLVWLWSADQHIGAVIQVL